MNYTFSFLQRADVLKMRLMAYVSHVKVQLCLVKKSICLVFGENNKNPIFAKSALE